MANLHVDSSILGRYSVSRQLSPAAIAKIGRPEPNPITAQGTSFGFDSRAGAIARAEMAIENIPTLEA